ncbi:carboxypeptidase Y [Trichophyton rubrum D6]|uniref:carboxypeptidase C n=1 Tax=Trichophyton rubrum CBS 288.86 TaxID=1215330 RepID=A0A022WBJ1_TRIRU|nr:carboxypeptidase Y [Trichophyton rubrum MR850]EZF44859.1 carboxypeptidase Y [Trichophyton rubrum CBS 100081]EZF55511.1 carboxypeptidase Y [Trichophyton rubrum CBS 288.86]EZF66092.1 carboxypeptidase Y [Trichophyton rubrum CBS 289.86]EZF87446.1 carboxypeptidase Y [Trichophyton rubrum MR1448]EZG19877.1 carboxypeptidase Y [Trichophyton rubrum CBS 202.88]KDB36667.1 carboxypeptidase Y [Trichophyton rubrum D6]
MKGLLSLLLVGAVTTSVASYESRSITEEMLQGKEKGIWDAIKGEVPGAKLEDYFKPPPDHQRKSDDKWDEGKDKPSGIEEYDMRFKTVDPSSLGVNDVTQYSGYLDNNKSGQHLSSSRRDPQYDSVILWLNGGPGCSSMSSLFMELGSARVAKDLTLTRCLWFLDPVLQAISSICHPRLPYRRRSYIKLKSVLIGNGMTDPYTQFASYPFMACRKGGYSAVLDQPTYKAMEAAVLECQKEIKRCYDKPTDTATCVNGAKFCKDALVRPYSQTGQSIYDIVIAKYLNQRHVQHAIGAEVSHFEGCNSRISSQFFTQGDYNQPFHRKIPRILKKINVLVYAGEDDYICNWLGVKKWTEALRWPGRPIFKHKKLSVVYNSFNKWPLGRVKYHNGLAFLQIFKAGHRVPYDQPENALDFLNRWLAGEWTPWTSSTQR